MAIRMRRGNEADFDPSKMLPGEWAVSTDTKYVRMCFSPGIVLRMATYEAFESDMAEIRKILSECQSIQTAIELIQKNVTASELVIENYVKEAKQYRDEAEQFRNEASMFAPEGYEDLVKNVSDNTVKIDTIIEKAELNIKNNAKGSNIHLTDSAEANVVSLELYGKTEQNAYTGKNLFTFPNIYYNGTGLNITKSTDGTYLLNGTSTGAELRFYDGYNSINKRLVVPNGTYKIVATINGEEITSTSTFAVITNGTTYASHYGTSFEITDGFAISSMAVNLTVGKNYTNSELKIMVCKQSEDNVLEPYVGGKPSPSPDYPQEIKSVKGKNLLDCSELVETTFNGITFTPIYDDNGNMLYVNVNGTASADVFKKIGNVFNPIIGQSYILNGCPSGGSNEIYKIYSDQMNSSNSSISAVNDFGNGATQKISSECVRLNVGIKIGTGTVCNNLKFYPMIRLASITDDTYVPYGLLRIKAHGKNLFDINNPTKEDYILSTDGTFIANPGFNSYRIRVPEDGLHMSWVRGSNFDAFRYGLEKDGNIKRMSSYGTEQNVSSNDADWLWISITPNENAQSEIMVTKGVEIAVPYEPYQESAITLSEPIELNGFNGVYDVVTSDGVTRRFAKVVFDGSEDELWRQYDGWLYSQALISTVKIPTTQDILPNVLCSMAKVVSRNDLTNSKDSMALSTNGNLNIYNNYYQDVEVWKTFLQSNPMTVVYELATPTTEELQSDFTALKTFYPETHVSNNADCNMSITYTADAKNYIDNKISLLTTAIYNNI